MIKKQVPMLTPLAIAVLALLDEGPMHPYELYQVLLHRHEDELVKIKPGSLYHTVARLAEQELVVAEGTDRAGNRPERTIYRIEPAGREALRTRVAEILRQPVNEYPIFPVALAEAHNLPVDDVVALVRERVTWIEGRIAEFDALRGMVVARQVPRRFWIEIEYLRAVQAAEVAWLHGFIAELNSGELDWEDFCPETGERRVRPAETMGSDWAAGLTDADIAAVRRGGAG
ncbi:PadR family transcriptional regulator [Nocardia yunnanensis]|uniref:PadR family transcriptional regulator n=1 Tax=Nocardia yunnanensis TaxID=2382165 RepID=A0A386Z4W0_9NOCA|nr:PadR family transcriptional regulator [Nocardia yunnanensis]AYF72691.1 PadR family transcriptional regulator [Nocardia yunnanensis]